MQNLSASIKKVIQPLRSSDNPFQTAYMQAAESNLRQAHTRD